MTKRSPTDEERLVLRFERARDEAQMSEREAREHLAELGVDADAEFKLLMATVHERDEEERIRRLAEAEAAYQQRQERPQSGARQRTRSENQAWVRAARDRHPELTAHHHDLTHMSDDDLASLVAQLEELEGDGEEG